MTRKDYELIAGALRKVRNSYAPHWDPNLRRALDDVGAELAHRFVDNNPRFDYQKFFAAAGQGTLT